MLAAALEGSHVVITPDLVQKLFAEEMGRAPHRVTPKRDDAIAAIGLRPTSTKNFSQPISGLGGRFRANAVFNPLLTLTFSNFG